MVHYAVNWLINCFIAILPIGVCSCVLFELNELVDGKQHLEEAYQSKAFY